MPLEAGGTVPPPPGSPSTSISELLAEVAALNASPGAIHSLTASLLNIQTLAGRAQTSIARARLVDFMNAVLALSHQNAASPHRLELQAANRLLLGAAKTLIALPRP
jgi:hypothetical protein